MAKKMKKKMSGRRKTTRNPTRPAGKRDLVRRPKAGAYAKRTRKGRFTELDDVGRSQKSDRGEAAKKKVRSGYGDQGDIRTRRRSGARTSSSRRRR